MSQNSGGLSFYQSFKGWRIVIATFLFLALVFVLAWGGQGITANSTLFLVRFTARTSFSVFFLAFIASSLHRLWKSSFGLWLLKNRKFLGVSMAVSHTYHAIVFTVFDVHFMGRPFPDANPFAIGAYLFLIAMTITSFAKPAKVIGRRAWQILHKGGMYYFWLIFTEEFVGRLIFAEKFSSTATKDTLSYSVLAILCLSGLLIRIFGRKAFVSENIDKQQSA